MIESNDTGVSTHLQDMSHLQFSFVKNKSGQIGIRSNLTNMELFPPCGSDLPGMYAYISGGDGEAAAQEMLRDVMDGKHPISDLRQSLFHPRFSV